MAVVGALNVAWQEQSIAEETSPVSLKFSMIGPKDTQTKSQTKSSEIFDAKEMADIVVVAEASGALKLEVLGVSDADKARISWAATRNTEDSTEAQATGDLTITIDIAEDGRKASVTSPSKLKGIFGSFLIKVKKASLTPTDPPTVIFTGRLIIVRSKVESAEAKQSVDWFFQYLLDDNGESARNLYSRDPSKNPTACINFSAELLLRGGGANEKLGTTKIKLGDVGNLISTSRKARYKKVQGTTTYWAEYSESFKAPATRLLDRTVGNAVDGKWGLVADSFRYRSEMIVPPLSVQPNAGLKVLVKSEDGPSFFPFQVSISRKFGFDSQMLYAASLSGQFSFEDYFVAYSEDFNQKAAILCKQPWTLSFPSSLDYSGSTPNEFSTGKCSIAGQEAPISAVGFTQTGYPSTPGPDEWPITIKTNVVTHTNSASPPTAGKDLVNVSTKGQTP